MLLFEAWQALIFFQDPQVFHNPESFDPERFRDVDGKIRKIDQFTPFGIGKRICMGESLSKNEAFIKWICTRISVSIDNIHKNAIMCHQYH